MTNEIRVIKNDDEKFSIHLNLLIDKSAHNPIYSTNFEQYYQEINPDKYTNKSVIFTRNDSPIAAFIFTQNLHSDVTNPKISYYGMPAQFIKEANLDDETADECVKNFLQYLNDNKIRAKNGKIHDSFIISRRKSLLN
jgi:hypothetical protein